MPDLLDLIIEGNILTISDSRPQVEAVGISKGVIASIGDFTEVEKNAGKNTQHIILKDQTIIPGILKCPWATR